MILLGNDINVYLDGTAIANAKNGGISLDAELIEVAPPLDGIAKAWILKSLSWGVNTSVLVGTVADLINLTGQTVTVSFGVADHASVRASGSAIVKSVRMDGARGNLAQASIEMVGTGTVSRTVYDLFWATVNSEYYRTSAGEKIRLVTER